MAARRVEFRAGETIHTENSYKYSVESFQALARGSGWSPLAVWTDGLFSVHLLRVADDEIADGRRSSGRAVDRPARLPAPRLGFEPCRHRRRCL